MLVSRFAGVEEKEARMLSRYALLRWALVTLLPIFVLSVLPLARRIDSSHVHTPKPLCTLEFLSSQCGRHWMTLQPL